MMKLSKALEEITVRKATVADAALLFEWRNDSETRRNSRDKSPLDLDTHKEWLSRTLQSSHRALYIVEINERPLGTIRTDVARDGYIEISYTIAPEFRGRRLSKPMVKRFADEFLKGKKIVAHIKKDHRPSESVARMLGLKPVSEVPSEDPIDDRPMVEWR
ncbi:MAG: hypothetical protein UY39_C0001G0010 [Candidatus Kaiserbacteria bacterium GW2011_GWC2_49_12]|uniref:N-acetyltransferase domain-containing protein n=4 Tax=Candidatus Kaiseribacteriota TaxID=1752734 RepID=A0A0G1YST2_9BACT|nr:MAG: hypothetical protein UY39_C0001G0010 [Candidatus Kaiserbacteria bacterium GW2011_GWC2_49_12]KKW18072.1 MAG: hypothetical protein UY57_C0002G0013 [Candidatus Kaiserbacteria bacterium GW2011_GWB1_50_17]KKW18565.1 MAG: hypothetical protein UY59_C0003G0013 [Candidatus Kaiserbacteria bacterium GW2011_GWA1_50_28]OGG87212.1 MAG: hypothetical protein A3H15_01305 [Candidatus Kaiserbacteria bacterium RIFCSPLOWO2_12_FULL_50_28]